MPPPPPPLHTHSQTLYKPHQSTLCINAPTHEKSNKLKLCIVFPTTRQQHCHRICLTLLQNLHHLQILVQSKISFLLFSSNSCISTQFLARTQGQYIHRSLPIGDKQKLVLSSLIVPGRCLIRLFQNCLNFQFCEMFSSRDKSCASRDNASCDEGR